MISFSSFRALSSKISDSIALVEVSDGKSGRKHEGRSNVEENLKNRIVNV